MFGSCRTENYSNATVVDSPCAGIYTPFNSWVLLAKKGAMTSRRDFLKAASVAGIAASAAHPLLSWAADHREISIPGKDGMIVRSYAFLTLKCRSNS
jgi:hypothetical protein